MPIPECQELDGLIDPEQIESEFSSTVELDGSIEPEQVAGEIEVCP